MMPSARSAFSILIFTALLCVTASATTLPRPVSQEGNIPFKYQGGSYQTHYKLFGDAKDLKARTPTIVLHGGPGLTYDYLAPFADLTALNAPVILYDQLGNGRSTHLPNTTASFWTIDLFVAELDNLINHFSVGKSFNLVGHSWGTVLASEYTVRLKPKGLKHLVLSDGLASIELWNESNGQLLQEFPADVQQGMMNGMADPPKFEAALKAYYAVHGNRVQPPPQPYLDTLDWLFGPKGDPTVASVPVMGPDWSIIDRCSQIKVPTLVINGRYDISQDFVIQPLVQKIPKAKWVKFQKSSHMPFWEERVAYMLTVGAFLLL